MASQTEKLRSRAQQLRFKAVASTVLALIICLGGTIAGSAPRVQAACPNASPASSSYLLEAALGPSSTPS